ncbi:MAG TPA: hypothetical protein VF821_01140 [Lentzea sp.]
MITVFLSVYHFDGDPSALLPGYDSMVAALQPDGVHACVVRPDGISVYDACPTREEFLAFSTGDTFRTALASAGLPEPRIQALGEVHEPAMAT